MFFSFKKAWITSANRSGLCKMRKNCYEYWSTPLAATTLCNIINTTTTVATTTTTTTALMTNYPWLLSSKPTCKPGSSARSPLRGRARPAASSLKPQLLAFGVWGLEGKRGRHSPDVMRLVSTQHGFWAPSCRSALNFETRLGALLCELGADSTWECSRTVSETPRCSKAP